MKSEVQRLIMATNNEHKLREIRQILGNEFEVKGLAEIGCHTDIPETAGTLEGNALQKARYVHEHYGLDCFADDTGLEVDALNGAPGVYTARFGQMNGYGDSHDPEANINCLLDKLKDAPTRRARFRTAIALVQGGEEHLFEGKVEGEILSQRTGGNGFGYDPIFAPEEANGLSFAEMGPDGKNAISHRARATQQLVAFLKRTALLLLCYLLPLAAKADTIGQWHTYRSYQYASQCVVAGNIIYANYAGNLLSYDTEDTEVRTYDQLNGLNGVTIVQMAYCSQAKRLVLIYDDCGIDLMDSDGTVSHIAALKEKNISGKTINAITIDGTMAYLAMGFGVVELDVKEGFLRNSYQLGIDVKGVVKLNGNYYAAANSGLYEGRQDANLFAQTGWKQIDTGLWKSLHRLDDGLIGIRWGYACAFWPGIKYRRQNNLINPDFLLPIEQGIIWGKGNEVYTCKGDGSDVQQLTFNTEGQPWLHVQSKGNMLWSCEGYNGMCAYKLSDGTLTRTVAPIQLNTPIRDLAYHLLWIGDRLLVAGGAAEGDAATAMTYEDGTWTNFTDMPIPADKPKLDFWFTNRIAQDPTDASHHFASVYRTGLCEYRNGKFVKIYDDSNSPLKSILPGDDRYYNYVSCAGAQYDTDGNLWVLNSNCDPIIHFMKPDGKWVSLKYDDLPAETEICDNYLMHSSGIRFINSRWGTKRGIFAFDTKATLTNTRDDRHRLRGSITNQDGTTYIPDYFYGMAEDLDGRIWCGTDIGVFVINDADAFFDDTFRFEQVKVPRNDGSGLADYLLSGVSISCITVDGGNRKWIGTHSDGLYLISADGREMLHHFTTANSPILHDCVHSVAVHPLTGEVMIGTEKGLCSFGGDATQGADELEASNVVAYPNPVTPDYTGSIAVRGLVMDSEVKILSATGQLVWSGTSNGGMFTWNGCSKSGNRVASGVYHVVANTPEGNKAIVTRIIVIR